MRLRYHDVYRRVYALMTPERRNAHVIHATRAMQIRKVPLRPRMDFARHIQTLARTQTIGGDLTGATLAAVDRMRRLAHIGACVKLRRLQMRIMQWLWRPNGPLMLAHVPRDLVG
jgi:hypothetical protein